MPTATDLDDLYISQPEGLPNRLYRNRGGGSFEDITDAAGLAILDRTSQSLFADVENDGDQDLILPHAHRPAAVPKRWQSPLHARP